MDYKLENSSMIQPKAVNIPVIEELIAIVKITKAAKRGKTGKHFACFKKKNFKNIKTLTLDNLPVPEHKVDNIKYIIGVDPRKNNRIISAYEVEIAKTELTFDKKKKRKYSFYSDTKSEDVLEKLNLYNYSFPTLKFDLGADILYLNRISYATEAKAFYFFDVD